MSDDLDPQTELDPAVLAALEADLRSPALWEEPPESLEDALVAAIAAEASPATSAPPSAERSPRWLWAVAAAVFLAAGFGLGALVTADDDTTEIVGESFVLEGTDLADGADGAVELAVLRNGLRIILGVENLPPAAEGQYYEAWLIRGDAVVSAGTFHMRNRTGSIELWAGVTPEAYPDFIVTLEDDDGDPNPSGEIVFEADVSSLVVD